jgi:hypothetical protein
MTKDIKTNDLPLNVLGYLHLEEFKVYYICDLEQQNHDITFSSKLEKECVLAMYHKTLTSKFAIQMNSNDHMMEAIHKGDENEICLYIFNLSKTKVIGVLYGIFNKYIDLKEIKSSRFLQVKFIYITNLNISKYTIHYMV